MDEEDPNHQRRHRKRPSKWRYVFKAALILGKLIQLIMSWWE